jgi:hypothetical protein
MLAINKQEFESLSNLAARAKLLSGKWAPKKRTKKYLREHTTLEPSLFTPLRVITRRGRDFLAAYEIIQKHLDSVYPEKLEGRPLPPERLTIRITGKPYRTPDGQLMLPVRIIEREIDSEEPVGA